jgi:hypothetical protein
LLNNKHHNDIYYLKEVGSNFKKKYQVLNFLPDDRRKTFLGENLLFWGREVFRSQVLQTYFRVILIALSFEIMQDICRRPLLK